MKNLFLLTVLILIAGIVSAQELDCRVTVNAERVQTTERAIFEDMETAFEQFLNDRKWSEDEFRREERIKCQFIIGIESMPSIGRFTATVQIQSVRPVYNTNLETSLLSLTQNYADKDWQFDYTESQPLDFNPNSFISNITSILGFYAYVIIGLDYDSFSLMGGNPYFEKAMTIATNAQQANMQGWQQFVSPQRNRYWLIENLQSQQMQSVREGIYEYHRLGLDTFLQDQDKSRETILNVLKKIQQAYRTRPNSFLITLFFYSKSSELVNIFSRGEMSVRREALEILTQLDPTNTDKYQEIVEN